MFGYSSAASESLGKWAGLAFVPDYDTHTHSVVSGHAYATINELVGEAKRLGRRLIAVTDHGPAMEHAPGNIYFRMVPYTKVTGQTSWSCLGVRPTSFRPMAK